MFLLGDIIIVSTLGNFAAEAAAATTSGITINCVDRGTRQRPCEVPLTTPSAAGCPVDSRASWTDRPTWSLNVDHADGSLRLLLIPASHVVVFEKFRLPQAIYGQVRMHVFASLTPLLDRQQGARQRVPPATTTSKLSVRSVYRAVVPCCINTRTALKRLVAH